MIETRRLLLIIGFGASLIGVLLIIAPSLGRSVSLSGIERTIPLALIGVIALILAAVYVFTEHHGVSTVDGIQREKTARIPVPEQRPQYTSSGVEFAQRLTDITWTDRRGETPENRLNLRSELREMAVTVLSQTEHWTQTEIETRLDNGSWTENQQAAAFFTDGLVPTLTIQQQIRSLLISEPVFARRARYVVAELASRNHGVSVSPELTADTHLVQDDSAAVTTRQYWRQYDGVETIRKGGRTRGVAAGALAVGGFGIITLHPILLLLAGFGIIVAGFVRITAPPSTDIEVGRTVTEDDPDPEETVEVTVSIRNTGNRTLTDIRLIDGVPAGLTVTEGSPRFTTALRPGKVARFTYSVDAVRGSHTFDPVHLITRDITGVHIREALVEGSPTQITCRPPSQPLAGTVLQEQTTRYAGESTSILSGSGITFRSLRDYHPGDSLSRINWAHKAKTGEFATVEFEPPRLAKVLVVVDVRSDAYLVSATDSDKPIVEKSIEAARDLTATFLQGSTPVGLTALSPQSCWLTPATGESHRQRIENMLVEDAAFGWETPDGEFDVSTAVKEISQRIHPGTQILFISPLCDDEAAMIARRFAADGYSISVVSPDPTAATSSRMDCGTGYASLTREFRLDRLRATDIPVVDWAPSTSFEEVMARESEGA